MSTSATITSLAVLKVNADRGLDFMDNFVPFVAETIRQSTTDNVSLPDVQRQLYETFGIQIPRAPLRTILGRAKDQKLVVDDGGVLRPNRAKLELLDFVSVRSNALREHQALIARLVTLG